MKKMIRRRLTKLSLLVTLGMTSIVGSVGLAQSSAESDQQQLDIYTYSSFVQGGITEAITPVFEKQCNCRVKFHDFGDAQSILTRLKIEGKDSAADLVIGLDQNLLGLAQSSDLFAPHQADLSALDLPIDWNDSVYVPFDYGYFSFVYRKDRVQDVPASFEALAESDLRIIIQDPRTSSPGLGLLLWVKALYDDRAPELWSRLEDNIVTATRGWSEAYGLFLKGESDMVLSYTTSPMYHEISEDDKRYRAALFDEGHYLQVELAALTRYAQTPDLANQFLQFMLTDEFQKHIATSNWMYPATNVGIPEPFTENPKPQALPLLDGLRIEQERDEWIDEWLGAF